MRLETLRELRQALADKVRDLDAIKPNCMSCKHFSKGRECDKFKAEPPAAFKTQPGQCADWDYDGIPF